MPSAPVYGLVLAGGRSRRMGRDKALLEHEGRSQLAHAMALIGRHVERVFVSTRADQQQEPERARYSQIVDRYDDLGPLAGILSALDEHPEADWLVVACDLPNIGDDTVANLLANRSEDHPFTAYISSHDGLPEPLCAIWRAGTAGIVRQFADEGVHCPRKILIRSQTHLVEQTDPASLDNVNTPADLASSVLEAAS
ncbi:MAG: molybdenum cofactor guanylyltransferase [Gammaproteobacteria bacterium]|nr:molybdenum cofactor guanylyltransferase [Gammaproteobacteria bacterium]MBT8105430.1 molybdenum cofactor guanylyltransferase [Gammaproteobacteria bacterium]NNF48437.1 molybdenum cofactor guanylyltransferase [Woeseiaceae bacterium]NNK25444.1 molybdenum cofactor guanylyltransferase [Woeseiaceae bacterium]NNL64371.1 molybdenum cofactor guanylyltransferase [Woeseiaceae bacterium]